MIERKTGWYLHFNARDTEGASKKITSQIKVFSQYFNITEVDIRLKSRKKIDNFFAFLPFGSLSWDYSLAYHEEIPDFVYVRKIHVDRKFYKFCRYVKKHKPSCKIISEIHTWPYYKTGLKFPDIIILLKDYLYSYLLMPRLIDRYVTYSDDLILFGVPSIVVKNGIEVNCEKTVSLTNLDRAKTINLISVAFYGKHHGIDRIFYGLSKYYLDGGDENYIIHLVGGGRYVDYYRNIVSDLKLENHVLFYGTKTGEELNKIYDIADVGVSTFGWYRLGVNKSSALKVREYLAKGLPVISGCREDVFDGVDEDFYLEFPNDDTNIDFYKISEFYHKLYDNNMREEVVRRIRKYAESHADMKVTMQPIMEYINE